MPTSMPVCICCIVEGHGEVESVPALIHRICQHMVPAPIVQRPIRWDRDRLVKPGEAERVVQLVAKSARPLGGGILILADADDDCPAWIGPLLLDRARSAAGGVPVALSLACREYESWFLAAAECFRGFQGLPTDLTAPGNSEEIRGAKEWLRRMAAGGPSYRPGVDQLPFTRRMDLELARRSSSFQRFEREVLRLIERLETTSMAAAP